MAIRVFFLFPPQVHLLDISGPIHVFYEAREMGADLSLIYLGFSEMEVKSSAGLTLSKLEDFEKYTLDSNDWIIVPGLDKKWIDNQKFNCQLDRFNRWIQEQQKHGAKICSICTGAYLLAQASILKMKKCTTHWKYLDDFEKRFPEVILLRDRLFVQDGPIYTSAGVASGIDLSLFIIEEIFGSLMAARVAKEIVVFLRRTENDPQLSIFLQYRNHLQDRIHQVQDLISQHLENGIKINELADQVYMSPRNLTRLFKKTTGITVGKYHEKLRIERASILLSQGQKVESVAHACGFSGAGQLRVLLKKQVGLLPEDLVSS